MVGDPYREPGAFLYSEPAQRLNLAPPFSHGDSTLFPLAWYQLDALVVAKKDYDDPLMPLDLGVAWGALLNDPRHTELNFRQSDRFLYTDGRAGLDNKLVGRCVSNVHIVPANDSVKSTLSGIEAGDYVSLQGSLVQVFNSKGAMTSSLSRRDSGEGACEILHVTSAIRIDPTNRPLDVRQRSVTTSRAPSGTPVHAGARQVVFAAKSQYPKEVILKREMEFSVDGGSVLLQPGDRITVIGEREAQAHAQYGQFRFWIERSKLESTLQ